MPLHLCAQGFGDPFGNSHLLPTLVVETENSGHTVSAGAPFQRRSKFFAIADAPGGGTRACGKTGDEGLPLHTGLRSQSARHIMQITYFVSLVGGKGKRFSEPIPIMGWDEARLQH